MGEYDCHYMLDNRFCEDKFLHEGDHHFVGPTGQTVTWTYFDDRRERDQSIGYPACLHPWIDKEVDCFRIINHDGDHASAQGEWSWPDDINNPEPEPEPEPAKPSVSPDAQKILDQRASDLGLRKIAVSLGDGGVQRWNVTHERVFDNGILYLETTEGDVTYAPGAWRSTLAEPVADMDD